MTRLLPLLLVVAACGDPQHPRQFPRWTTPAAEVQWRDCVGLRAFVRKSGKEGIGVTLEVRSKHDCAVRVRATVALEDGTVSAVEQPLDLRGRTLAYQWLAFRLDGDRAWNNGARAGRIDVEIETSEGTQPVASFPLAAEWHGVWGSH